MRTVQSPQDRRSPMAIRVRLRGIAGPSMSWPHSSDARRAPSRRRRRGPRALTHCGSRGTIELARRADVLVENFLPGVTERLGLGYAAVRAANPSIVYASISGFGQTGPLARKAGYN